MVDLLAKLLPILLQWSRITNTVKNKCDQWILHEIKLLRFGNNEQHQFTRII